MNTHQLRRQFLDYFKKHGHAVIASSAVVPHDDPTLLFINAGMNQFKDVFLGDSLRDYTRATTSQKCIRVGGKHNDLENVGHTSRHLTFFEMLGNFSFGDYFKKEAILFAWEVATQVFGFDPDRIWPTVFRDDDEAFELWTHYVPRERITRFGEKENFWAMGETGPCGPCSELLYDRGPAYGSATCPAEDTDGERYLEFWNLVFMQYNRDSNGQLEPLPKPSIDTGAGLERVMSLKMGVDSVFETDILRSLIAQVESISKVTYDSHDARAPAFRVIADHLRSLSFAIADGVQPSNVDRGYVLRKILRRAVRYGRQLGLEEPFLAKVFPKLVEVMGPDYHELQSAKERIIEILTVEEESFLRTLRRGGNILNQIIDKSQKQASKEISGDDAFRLKDTYGLPIDEILLLAKDSDLTVDIERYQVLEQEAKERSRSTQKTTQQVASENLFVNYATEHGECRFLGYGETTAQGKVTALVVNGQLVDRIEEGEEGLVVLDQTPFYAEMGGQTGDIGILTAVDTAFEVTGCEAPFKGVIAHVGKVKKGSLQIGNSVIASIDVNRRQKIANNHTATHLLHWALHKVLGEHVKQAGSVVDAGRLRFDFSHHKALTKEEIEEIQKLVNEKIRENWSVQAYELSYDEAQKNKAIKQFFGEKYGSSVRVVDIDFSKELCGGTHVSQLGSIGFFKIAKESSIAAGIRRIEAVTGLETELLIQESEKMLLDLAEKLKTQISKLPERVEKLLEENKLLSLQLKAAKKAALSTTAEDLLEKIENVDGISFLAAQIDVQTEELRACADELSQRIPSGIIILGTALAIDQCQLLVRVSDDLVSKGFKAGEIVKEIAPFVEGSGGGKANSAQAGGKVPHAIPQAFRKAKELITSLVSQKLG